MATEQTTNPRRVWTALPEDPFTCLICRLPFRKHSANPIGSGLVQFLCPKEQP